MRQSRSNTSKQISPRQDGERSSRRPRQERLQQINYHSQPKKTKVDVTYDSSMLLKLCAHRLHFGDGKIGGNPCSKLEKKAIKAVDKLTLPCTSCS